MSSAVVTAAFAPIADIQQVRFDRALELLHEADPAARVALDDRTGLAIGLDVNVAMPMPQAALALPAIDRAAASAVLFLDRYGALVGVSGWHALDPQFASPVGETVWFTFAVEDPTHPERASFLVNVCADGEAVRHVRVERSRST